MSDTRPESCPQCHEPVQPCAIRTASFVKVGYGLVPMTYTRYACPNCQATIRQEEADNAE